MEYEFSPESNVDIVHKTIVLFVIKNLYNGRYYNLYRGMEQEWLNGAENATTYPDHSSALKVITEEIEIDGNFTIETIYEKKIKYG